MTRPTTTYNHAISPSLRRFWFDCVVLYLTDFDCPTAVYYTESLYAIYRTLVVGGVSKEGHKKPKGGFFFILLLSLPLTLHDVLENCDTLTKVIDLVCSLDRMIVIYTYVCMRSVELKRSICYAT